MHSGMFDGMIRGLLCIGAALGVGAVALAYALWFIASHVHLTWR